MATKEYEFLLLQQGEGSPHGTCRPSKLGDSNIRSNVSGLHGSLEDNFSSLAEGGYVIDSRRSYTNHADAAYAMLFNGPLADECLAPGTFRRLTFASEIPIETYMEGTVLGGCDHVALDVYAVLWHRAGSRVGIRKGTDIEWADGTVERIVPPSGPVFCRCGGLRREVPPEWCSHRHYHE